MSDVYVCIFGKDDCEMCKLAKVNLSKMGFTYEEEDMEDLKEYKKHFDWRERGLIKVMAAFLLNDGNLPIIQVNDKAYNFKEAMLVLSELSEENVEVETKVHCENGTCKLTGVGGL